MSHSCSTGILGQTGYGLIGCAKPEGALDWQTVIDRERLEALRCAIATRVGAFLERIVVRRHLLVGTAIAECAVVLMAFTVPRKAAILPVGSEMVEAYNLLGKSGAGRDLVRRVARSANDSYIYLTLGDTDRDGLVDESGRGVRGVTRAVLEWGFRGGRVSNVTVITNREVTGSSPHEIVRSLAFELENVRYLYESRGSVSMGADSPRARHIQRKVVEELGLGDM